jgi:hypothetical protein
MSLMLRTLLIAMWLIPSAVAQDRAEDLATQPRALQDDQQFAFEIRFLMAAEQVIDQIPEECLTEISKPEAGRPFENWNQMTTLDKVGNGALLIGEPTVQIRPTEATRVAVLRDDQIRQLIQSAQGDSRSNIMQAPKVTVFRDQVATIEDLTSTPVQPIDGTSASSKDKLLNGTQIHVRVTADKNGTLWADSEILLYSESTASHVRNPDNAPKTPVHQLTSTFRVSQAIGDGTNSVVIVPPIARSSDEEPKPRIKLTGFRRTPPASRQQMLIAIRVRRLEELELRNTIPQ